MSAGKYAAAIPLYLAETSSDVAFENKYVLLIK
jgi:hypothetical protein